MISGGKLKRWGPVFEPELPWEENNVRDPFLLPYGDTFYMYYVGGNEKGIALTKIPCAEMNKHASEVLARSI